MFSAIKRLFAPKAPAPEPDAIVDALRAGRKDEAVRLVAEAGVWIPHRDQKEEANGSISVRYYDTEDCFPVFSSLDRVIPYMQKIGVIDGTKVVSIPALQATGQFFAGNPDLLGKLIMNPASDAEWKFDAADFAAISNAIKKEG